MQQRRQILLSKVQTLTRNSRYAWPADIWAMGVILYELCALKLPFDGGALAAVECGEGFAVGFIFCVCVCVQPCDPREKFFQRLHV